MNPEQTPLLVVVPCGAAKLERPAPARELYVGGQFRLGLAAGDALAARIGGTVAILSARYGLVRPELQLAPYDLRMGDPGSVTTETLTRQLRDAGAERLHLLLPKAYAAALEAAADAAPWLITTTSWLAGTRGLLEQRSVLARIRRGECAE